MRFRHFIIALAITLGLLFSVTRQSRAQTSDKSDKEGTLIHILGVDDDIIVVNRDRNVKPKDAR
jgi:hypothetical protein